MPRLNCQKRTKKQVQRAMLFRSKLLECNMTFFDVSKELGMDKGNISKFAYAESAYKRGRLRGWVVKKFGESFIKELDQLTT